jgi:serine/threonine protein phosphatase PrpC
MAAAPLDEASRVTLEAWLVTDVGVVREHNEDAAYMEPANGFFIVADGMGGHAAGEVASAMAVDTVRKTLEAARPKIDSFKRTPTDAGRRDLVQLLQSAVLSAHQAVFQRGQQEADKAGMGTTLDVVLIAGPEAFVAHVGDSRTYLVRDGRSSQITTDHTVAEVLVIEGKLTIEEAQVSPLRTILVNAIGVSADVGVEMAHVTLKRGDRMLLCSDGLHDYFPGEEEIAAKLSADAPGDALKDMVELAKTRGGHDNITGVAVQVTDVIDAVPAQLDGDLTQPVDVPGINPFASDEPTETALIDPPGLGGKMTPLSPAELKSTQPMRILEDEPAATADTIPPLDEPPRLEPPPNLAKGTSPKSAAEGSPASGPNEPPELPELDNAATGDAEGPLDAEAAEELARELAKTDEIPPIRAGESGDSKLEIQTPAEGRAADAGPDGAPAEAANAGATATPAGHDRDTDGKQPSGAEAPGEAGTNGVEPDAAPSEMATADTGRVTAPSRDQDGKDQDAN